MNVIPIILIGGFFIATPLPANGTYAALFVLSFILSFMVNWLFAALFSLLSFVTINMSPLVQVKKHVLRLLSGSIIPIWFFPDQVKFILELLPFIYIYQLPLDIYIGKYSYNVILLKMGIQLLWVIFLFAAFLIAERHMQRKVMVQGG